MNTETQTEQQEEKVYGWPKAVHELAEVYISRDVLYCQSSLVDDCIKHEVEGFSYDAITNINQEDALHTIEDHVNWLDDRDIDHAEADEIEDEDEKLEALEELARDNSEPQEIFEWWLVTDWLAGKLSKLGEPVLEVGNCHWWGRGCSGQSIILDGTIQKIAQHYV